MATNFALHGFVKKTPSTCRLPEAQVALTQRQFCKWLAKEKHVSSDALFTAMSIISDGMVLAIARGYRLVWRGLLSIELRELPARKRYHRLEKIIYEQPPSCRVHIGNASDLNKRVREIAKAEVENAVRQISLSYPNQK